MIELAGLVYVIVGCGVVAALVLFLLNDAWRI